MSVYTCRYDNKKYSQSTDYGISSVSLLIVSQKGLHPASDEISADVYKCNERIQKQ